MALAANTDLLETVLRNLPYILAATGSAFATIWQVIKRSNQVRDEVTQVKLDLAAAKVQAEVSDEKLDRAAENRELASHKIDAVGSAVVGSTDGFLTLVLWDQHRRRNEEMVKELETRIIQLETKAQLPLFPQTPPA